MPPLAKYKYTRLTRKLDSILRDAPRIGRPKEISATWLRSGYGVSNNEGSIISVLRFIGLIRHDGTPTDLWDALRDPSAQKQQRELLKDSIRAAEADLFSAAHVLAWSGFTGFFYKPFTVDIVKAEHPDWEMRKIENLLRFKDYQLIEAGWKELGFYNRGTEKTLQGLLNDRNRCAHGSGYFPDLNETWAFLKKLFDMIEYLQNSPGSRWT